MKFVEEIKPYIAPTIAYSSQSELTKMPKNYYLLPMKSLESIRNLFN